VDLELSLVASATAEPVWRPSNDGGDSEHASIVPSFGARIPVNRANVSRCSPTTSTTLSGSSRRCSARRSSTVCTTKRMQISLDRGSTQLWMGWRLRWWMTQNLCAQPNSGARRRSVIYARTPRMSEAVSDTKRPQLSSTAEALAPVPFDGSKSSAPVASCVQLYGSITTYASTCQHSETTAPVVDTFIGRPANFALRRIAGFSL
jgi:hypothetical protein